MLSIYLKCAWACVINLPLAHQRVNCDLLHAKKMFISFQTSHYDDVRMGAIASQITSLTIVYSTVYSGADQSKHQSSASLAFVWWIHRGPVNSPHKWPVTRKMFPFDDVIMSSGPEEEYSNYVFLLQLLTTSAETLRTYMFIWETRSLIFPLWEARYIS